MEVEVFLKMLITGGAGFIGSNTAEYYYNLGHNVYVLDNLSTGKRENIDFIREENFFNLDIRDYEEIKRLIKEYKFEVIIHLAAVVSVVDTVENPIISNEVNINATLKLLELNRKYNNNIQKIIFASSAAVYGNDPNLPKNLDSKICPESPYAIQKYAGELYLKNYTKLYGLPTVGLRFFNVYGPKQNPASQYSGVISILKEKIENNSKFIIFGDGLQTRDFVYVKDVVKAINIVTENIKSNGNIYNVGSGKSISLIKMLRMFERHYNKKLNYEYAAVRVGDVKHSLADIELIKRLGYVPEYSIEKGISEYLSVEKVERGKVSG